MKKLTAIILIFGLTVVFAPCLRAENKVKVLTVEIETGPISVKPVVSFQNQGISAPLSEKLVLSSHEDPQTKEFYEQKIKLMEKYIELKSKQIELLRESVAQREATINKLQSMQ